jgi:hypothetical protein
LRPDTITLAIFEKYTAEELAETAASLAQAISDRETTKNEKKASDAAFNERITKHDTDISDLAKKYVKGGETAQIGCDIRYDHPEPGKKSYFRMDRNELVETHEMNWEEKQETIQFPLAQNAAAPTDEQVNDALAKMSDEVTKLCAKSPGCIHFADHDGPCEFPPPPSINDSPMDQPPEAA